MASPAHVANVLTWTIAAVAATGALVRPFRMPEVVWAVGGALLLVGLGLLPADAALGALARALDVCLFLIGMMLLSETARREGLFDWLAAFAVERSGGSPRQLFALVYGAGVIVTVFLSNDATAVVMTPAVFAAARRAKTPPLPHLFACAMVANAASFVLPISNPANLVLYAGHTPPLGAWLASFALPSLFAVAATYVALRWAEAGGLEGACETGAHRPQLGPGARIALAGLGLGVAVLLTASALGWPLGLPTALTGAAVASVITIARRASPLPLLADVSWSVIAFAAALFVIVEALDRTGLMAGLGRALADLAVRQPRLAPWAAGGLVAGACNLVNNLPAGVIASLAAQHAHASPRVTDTLLIGVDLGPNLSVTGSLATILWLAALRREGETVGFWRFLATGALVMPPALLLALAARILAP